MRRETQELPPLDAPKTLVVERRGDRFVIVDGHYLYEAVKALEQPLVKCYIEPAAHSRIESGTLVSLKTAAVSLSEQIELEASWAVSSATAAKAYPTSLARNIDRLRNECGWSFDDLAKVMSLNKKSVLDHVNKGAEPRPDTKTDYARTFSEKLGRTISVEDLSR